MARTKRVLIFPLAAEGSPSDLLAGRLCRGLAGHFDETLGRLQGIDTILQHLMIAPDGAPESANPITIANMWTLEQALELPVPEELEATHLLHGALNATGEKWRLTLQLIDLELRLPTFERSEEFEPDALAARVLGMQREIAELLLEEPLRQIGPASLRLASPNPSAYRHYLTGLGLSMMHRLKAPMHSIEECLQEFVAAIENDPEFAAAAARLNAMAIHLLWERQEKEEEVVALLARALAAAPKIPAFKGTLGMWYAAKGDIRTGQPLLERYVQEESEAPLLSRGLGILGTLYRRQGRVAEARISLERAVLRDGDNLPAWEELAGCHVSAGEWADAERCLRRALEIEPERSIALLNLGVVFWNKGDRERALLLYRKAALAPDANGTAVHRYAEALLEFKRYEEADEVVTPWAEAEADDPNAWLLLARIRRLRGQVKAARFCLEKMRELPLTEDQSGHAELEELALAHPGDHALFLKLLELEGTQTASVVPDTVETGTLPPEQERRLQLMSDIAERHAGVFPLWIALAESYSKANRHRDAVAAQSRTVALLQESPAQVNTLGVLCVHAGHLEAAERNFGRAIELAPTFSGYHTNLGLCLAEQKQWRRAHDCFLKALELNPADEVARRELLNLDRRERHAEIIATTTVDPEYTGVFQKLRDVLAWPGKFFGWRDESER